MRLLTVVLLALLTLAAPALAHPGSKDAQAQLRGSRPLLVPPISTSNVEFIKNIPLHTDSPGARLHDGFFYITTERDLVIYDVKDPANPVETGRLTFPAADAGEYYFPEEDVDTNGEVLITSNGAAVQVYDVRDKTAPKLLSRLAGTDQHTISCVLDCTWAYGSEGSIVDLRDPARPVLAGNWRTQHPNASRHDVTEVAPGIILTATQPMVVLDARENPAAPKLLAKIANADNRFQHATLWPREGEDRFALVGGEATGPRCEQSASATFQTYDTTGWRESGTFRLVDQFRVLPGTIADGRAPTATFCVHWFTTHPKYRDGGLVAISWYEHGTRILEIDAEGQIEEVGHVLSPLTSASAAYWISDDVFYVADYNRGLDVLRYTGPQPAAKGDGGKKAKKAR